MAEQAEAIGQSGYRIAPPSDPSLYFKNIYNAN